MLDTDLRAVFVRLFTQAPRFLDIDLDALETPTAWRFCERFYSGGFVPLRDCTLVLDAAGEVQTRGVWSVLRRSPAFRLYGCGDAQSVAACTLAAMAPAPATAPLFFKAPNAGNRDVFSSAAGAVRRRWHPRRRRAFREQLGHRRLPPGDPGYAVATADNSVTDAGRRLRLPPLGRRRLGRRGLRQGAEHRRRRPVRLRAGAVRRRRHAGGRRGPRGQLGHRRLPPGRPGYAVATADNSVTHAGAAYVYRRSAAGRWAIEAYVKAPNTGAFDQFGFALALSADGATLAVGAGEEDSAADGAFHPADSGYADALRDDNARVAGAAYVYRRSAAGVWAIEAYVKAPNSGGGDRFGEALALSADGAALAVGARTEDSTASGAFHPGDPGYAVAIANNAADGAGAAYVYQRSSTGVWAVEAYLKAPNSGEDDQFGFALALSADGATLAVGAGAEDSAADGASTPATPATPPR